MTPSLTKYAHGKFLITGEYLVMEGARALALPVNRGQFLKVRLLQNNKTPQLHWTALKPDGLWFKAVYLLPELKILDTTHTRMAEKLAHILTVTRQLNPSFLNEGQSFDVETYLEFDTEFGWGSSSTLVSNLASWAGVDAFALQWKALGGSGYDVACASANGPLFYQIVNGRPTVKPVSWNPSFKEHLFFVYLGKKQRSDQSIKKFKQQAVFSEKTIQKISNISTQLVKTESLSEFEKLLQQHEAILSDVLGVPPIHEKYFANYSGTVKSLGAWGGDFVLVTSHKPAGLFKEEMKEYGFQTLFSWDELALNPSLRAKGQNKI